MKRQSLRLKQGSHNCHSNQVRRCVNSWVMTAKKSSKKCAVFSVFVLLIKPIAFSALFTLIFLIFVIVVVALSLLVALPHKTIQYGTILEKTRRDLPTQKLICEVVSFCNYIIPDCISYQVICMWENKQRLGRQITSTAECGCSFQSLHIITCNIKHSQKPKCRDLSPPNTLY